MNRFVFGGVLLVALLIGRVPEAAATVLINGSGSGLSASASFTISGTTLTILLTNTDTTPRRAEWAPSEVLTGLFFNLGTASDAFTPVSATGSIAQPSQCLTGPCDNTTNVGGEWSYAFGGVVDPDVVGANRGISSAGYLNANTSQGNFRGTDLDSPPAINGINFGIAPKTFTEGSGNSGLDRNPLVQGSATFVLDIPQGLTEAMISNVYFTYGTDLNKPSFTTTTTNGSAVANANGGGMGSVPEPSLLALAVAGVALASYRLGRNRSRSHT